MLLMISFCSTLLLLDFTVFDCFYILFLYALVLLMKDEQDIQLPSRGKAPAPIGVKAQYEDLKIFFEHVSSRKRPLSPALHDIEELITSMQVKLLPLFRNGFLVFSEPLSSFIKPPQMVFPSTQYFDLFLNVIFPLSC